MAELATSQKNSNVCSVKFGLFFWGSIDDIDVWDKKSIDLFISFGVKLLGESNEIRFGEYGLRKKSEFFIFVSDLLISFILSFSFIFGVKFSGVSLDGGNNLL